MISPSDGARILYESDFSIFNGRLCTLRISNVPVPLEEDGVLKIVKLRITSPSDASILLDTTIEPSKFQKLGQVLTEILSARSLDPTILGPRIEPIYGESENPYRLVVEPIGKEAEGDVILIPLRHPTPQERCDYVMKLYAREKAQHQQQATRAEELTKQLQHTVVEYNSLKQKCDYQEKEIALLRQLVNRKRTRDDSETTTPRKKRRCQCGDEGGECSDCDGGEDIIVDDDDDEDDDELDGDVEMFRAAAAQLQMANKGTHNVEVSHNGPEMNPTQEMTLMKQLEQLSSVIVKAPNLPSASNIRIKMEEGQEQSGPLVLKSPKSDQKVVGVVQYVICQLCPEEEQKSMDLTDQQQMEEHFLDKHVDKEKKKCEACPSDQFQPHNIGQHYRLHTNSVYACQHCGKRGRRNYLMSHVRVHTGERPFSCDTCSKTFADGSTLRRHRLVHTGEKKYQCPVCGRAIARKDNVKVHIRSHGIHI